MKTLNTLLWPLLLVVSAPAQAFFCFNFNFGTGGGGGQQRAPYYPPLHWAAPIPVAPPPLQSGVRGGELSPIAPEVGRVQWQEQGGWHFRPLK
jgi:hypothetical protein